MRILIMAAMFLALSGLVTAAGIGVAPSEIKFELEKGQKQQRQLTVYNLDDLPAEFEVWSSSDYLSFSHSGIMEKKEKIIVEADSANLEEGYHESYATITTLGQQQGVGLSIGTQVKIAVIVKDSNKTNILIGILTTITTVAIGMLSYYAALRLRIYGLLRKLASYW